ncbi:hypothetical protein [Ensifer canadensis]
MAQCGKPLPAVGGVEESGDIRAGIKQLGGKQIEKRAAAGQNDPALRNA